MKCSFCGISVEPGTGKVYVKKDGKIFYFCSRKCEKNLLKLKRKARKVRWTKMFQENKGSQKDQKG